MLVNFNDNSQPIDPSVLAHINQTCDEHARIGLPAYGQDEITKSCREMLSELFARKCDTYFIPTGTGANALAIGALVTSTDSIVCSSMSHIFMDECNVLQQHFGVSLRPVESIDGKLSVPAVARALQDFHSVGWYHHSLPKVISITQPTECGAVYSAEEIRALSLFAKEKGMYVHVDGARLPYAMAYLDTTLRENIGETGVDVLTLNATKLGGVSGNAVLFFNGMTEDKFLRLQKQAMGLVDRSWFMAAQFGALFGTERWMENAYYSVRLAKKLGSRLESLGVSLAYPVTSNAVFCYLERHVIHKLQQQFSFYIWDERTNLCRFVCSRGISDAEIDLLTQAICGADTPSLSVVNA